MATRSLRNELGRQLPVLFAHIGWAHHYDGSEPIRGNFAWLKENPRENGEASAFLPDSRGFFGCGIGPGGVKHDKIHVGFLAGDPADHFLKVVGLYAAATVEANPEDPNWPRARTKNGLLLPLSRRRPIAVWLAAVFVGGPRGMDSELSTPDFRQSGNDSSRTSCRAAIRCFAVRRVTLIWTTSE
jgi:hypothetical protein